MMQFADQMLSESVFLRGNCRDLEEYRDPEEPLPISLLGHFGGEIAKRYDTISPEEWRRLSALIEQGLASDDSDIGTAVEGLWPRVEAALGPQARSYADAYRNAGLAVKT